MALFKIKKKMWRKVLIFFLSLIVVCIIIIRLNLIRKKRIKNGNTVRYAIIFVPGIGCSALFNTNKESLTYNLYDNVWLYGDEWTGGNFWSSKKSKKNIIEDNYKDLSCNKFGIPLNKSIKPITKPIDGMSLKQKEAVLYGYDNMFKSVIQDISYFLRHNFFKECDIFVHNYDWRLGCNKNSRDLAKVIEKYDKVIVIGYSLGGLVSLGSFRILKKKKMLNKVKGFIACGTPFRGSFNTVFSMKTGLIVNTFLATENVKKISKALMLNYESMYNILPSVFFSQSTSRKNIDAFFDKNELNKILFYKALRFYKKIYLDQDFVWYNDVNNIYIIHGIDHKVTDIGFMDNYNLKKATYIDGDGIVSVDSAYPNYLQNCNTVKKVFKVKERHDDLIRNKDVQNAFIEFISEIFNINNKDIDYYNIAKKLDEEESKI